MVIQLLNLFAGAAERQSNPAMKSFAGIVVVRCAGSAGICTVIVDAAATTVFTLFGARANYELRV